MTITKACSVLEPQKAVLCRDKDWICQSLGGKDCAVLMVTALGYRYWDLRLVRAHSSREDSLLQWPHPPAGTTSPA